MDSGPMPKKINKITVNNKLSLYQNLNILIKKKKIKNKEIKLVNRFKNKVEYSLKIKTKIEFIIFGIKSFDKNIKFESILSMYEKDLLFIKE